MVSVGIRRTISNAMNEPAPQPKAEAPKLKVQRPMNAPSMNTSPWAKLMSWMMPYTIVYPSAIRA